MTENNTERFKVIVIGGGPGRFVNGILPVEIKSFFCDP